MFRKKIAFLSCCTRTTEILVRSFLDPTMVGNPCTAVRRCRACYGIGWILLQGEHKLASYRDPATYEAYGMTHGRPHACAEGLPFVCPQTVCFHPLQPTVPGVYTDVD